MHIKQLSTLEQIKHLQELLARYVYLEEEINSVRKEYSPDSVQQPPAVDTIIKTLKIKYADEKIAESTAMVNPS